MLAHAAFAALVIVASLNRETGVYLGVIWFLLAQSRHERLWGIGYVGLSAAIFVGLRLALGDPAFYHTRESLLVRNLSEPQMFLPATLFLLAFVVPALVGAWRSPARRLLPLAALTLAMFAAFAVWREVRVLWVAGGAFLLMFPPDTLRTRLHSITRDGD